MTGAVQNGGGHRPRRTLRLTCSITADGKLDSVNDVMCYVLGYTQGELKRAPVGALLRPGEDVYQTEAEIMAKFKRVQELDDGSVESFQSWMLARDQVPIHVNSTVTWNSAFKRWDVIAEIDAAEIAHRPRPQFPPDDPDAQLARMELNQHVEARRQAEMVRLLERFDEARTTWEQMQNQDRARVQEIAAAAAAAAAAAIYQQMTFVQNGTELEPVRQQVARMQPPEPSPAPAPETTEISRFDIEEWNTYAGFREHVVGLWRDGMTRTVLAGLAGTSARTFYRARERWHVNGRRDWPPTRWPLQEPKPKPKSRSRRLPTPRQLGGMAAAALLSFVTLDVGVDGRLDGALRLCVKAVFSMFGGDAGWTFRL